MGVISSGWSFAPKLFNPQLFKQIMLPPPARSTPKKSLSLIKLARNSGLSAGRSRSANHLLGPPRPASGKPSANSRSHSETIEPERKRITPDKSASVRVPICPRQRSISGRIGVCTKPLARRTLARARGERAWEFIGLRGLRKDRFCATMRPLTGSVHGKIDRHQ
jgi:hypothetical protein